LPLGKIVTAPSGFCVYGDALQIVAQQSMPASPGPINVQAFRAVHVGRGQIYHDYPCGEACLAPFKVMIAVTNGCELRPRQYATYMALYHSQFPPPQSPAQSPPPSVKSISAKLIKASQYQQIFHSPLDLQPDALVWAVLYLHSVQLEPTPAPATSEWFVAGIDACTDWLLPFARAQSDPPGWSSVTDQAPA
jgi:hypothetical protein